MQENKEWHQVINKDISIADSSVESEGEVRSNVTVYYIFCTLAT